MKTSKNILFSNISVTYEVFSVIDNKDEPVATLLLDKSIISFFKS
jgi:hypothetical protein